MLLGEHAHYRINKPFLLHKTFFFKGLCIPRTGDFFFFFPQLNDRVDLGIRYANSDSVST